jgi:hypothetical protein
MTSTIPATVSELLDYWPGSIPFKGGLISDDGCMCAQGQALHFLNGLSPDELRKLHQSEADKKVAEIFGISLAHSVLLRIVNDSRDGAPSVVIRNPEKILGDQAQVILAFWHHLDTISSAAWEAVGAKVACMATGAAYAAWKTAREAAKAAFGETASMEAGTMASDAAWGAIKVPIQGAFTAAPGATNEIQGAAIMRANNQPFLFLPLLGFATPENVIEAETGK